MKIGSLKEFLYLSEELNFSETARHFYINQSALSRHIADLENELGVELFLRNRKSVRLTSAGKALVERAQVLVEEHDSILHDFKKMQDEVNSHISIGYLQGAASSFLPVAVRLFKREYPSTALTARSMQPDQILDKLKSDDIDIGITMRANDASLSLFESYKLYDDEFSLMVSSSHPFAASDSILSSNVTGTLMVPENFPHEPDLNKFLLDRLAQAGIAYRVSAAIDDMESMPLLLAHGPYAVASCQHLSGMFGRRFKHVRLEDVDLGYSICAIFKKSRRNQAILDFCNCLQYSYETVGVDHA